MDLLAGSRAEERAEAKAQGSRKPLKAAEPPAIASDSHIHLSTELAEHPLEVASSKTHPPPTFAFPPTHPLVWQCFLCAQKWPFLHVPKSHIMLQFPKENMLIIGVGFKTARYLK